MDKNGSMKTNKYFLMLLLLAAPINVFADEEAVIPGSNQLKIMQRTRVLYDSRETLRKLVSGPIPVDPVVIDKVVEKLIHIGEESTYPAIIACALRDLAFTDPEGTRLTDRERTNNMAYILSNLAAGNTELVLHLYTFYYGYTFRLFANEH